MSKHSLIALIAAAFASSVALAPQAAAPSVNTVFTYDDFVMVADDTYTAEPTKVPEYCEQFLIRNNHDNLDVTVNDQGTLHLDTAGLDVRKYSFEVACAGFAGGNTFDTALMTVNVSDELPQAPSPISSIDFKGSADLKNLFAGSSL